MAKAECRMSNSRGFSLLELLIASLVVAGTGLLLFSGLAQITRSRQLKQEQTIMRELLANRLALLETVTEGEQVDGACEAPYETYRWTVSTSAGALPSVAHVTVSITSPSAHTMDASTVRPLTSAP